MKIPLSILGGLVGYFIWASSFAEAGRGLL
jgi:hypothetical protein